MNINHLAISWTTSRGQDTYGYNICRLDDRANGRRFRTCGGGYDMLGTVFGDWLQETYQERLQALVKDLQKEECGYAVKGYQKVKEFYGLTINPDGTVSLDGGCGLSSMQRVAEAIGLEYQWEGNRKGHTVGYFISDKSA